MIEKDILLAFFFIITSIFVFNMLRIFKEYRKIKQQTTKTEDKKEESHIINDQSNNPVNDQVENINNYKIKATNYIKYDIFYN